MNAPPPVATTRPLRVGVVCFPAWGGSGVVGSTVAALLARRGHEVHVIAGARPGRLPADDARLRFHVVDRVVHPALASPPDTITLASAIADLSAAHDLELLHVHYAVPHAAAALLARAALGAAAPALVTTLHGTDVTQLGHTALRTVTRAAVRASDAITVPSRWLHDEAAAWLAPGPAPRIEVVPNFIDPTEFCPKEIARCTEAAAASHRTVAPAAPTGDLLVHVSNFRAVKRVDDAVRAFALVRAARPAAQLHLVGDGPERPAVQALAAALGVADAVHFVGERVHIVDQLAGAAVFLLPSETESFGLAALEALACGVPVVASRVGGLPEVVADGECGLLVPPGDPAAMADAALRLLADPALRRRYAEAGRQRAHARFAAGPILDQWERVYLDALDRRAHARA